MSSLKFILCFMLSMGISFNAFSDIKVEGDLNYVITPDDTYGVKSIFAKEERLFVISGNHWYNVIDIYNIQDPSSPQFLKRNEVNCPATELFTDQNKLFLFGPNNICAFDVNSDDSLKEVFNHQFTYSGMDFLQSIQKIGNRIVFNRIEGNYYQSRSYYYYLNFINDEVTLEEIDDAPIGKISQMKDNFLYTTKNNKLYKYDISNPEDFNLVDEVTFPYDIKRIGFHNNMIYINLLEVGYFGAMYDMTKREIKTFKNSHSYGQFTHYRQKVIGNTLYTLKIGNKRSDKSHGTFEFIEGKKRPDFNGYSYWPGKLEEVIPVSNYLYFAMGKGGLVVVENK